MLVKVTREKFCFTAAFMCAFIVDVMFLLADGWVYIISARLSYMQFSASSKLFEIIVVACYTEYNCNH